MSLHIRHLTTADIAIGAIILDAAYGVSEDRATPLQRYLAVQPDGWFLATQNNNPVGVVGAVHYGPFAYIGMMAVHPLFQRQGIGSALMQRLLAWLDASRCLVALLDATDAGIPLYRRFGFSDIAPTFLWQARSHTPTPQPSERVRPFCQADLPVVIAFDAPIFGAPRATVLRTYLAAYPERAFVVYDNDGDLAGYVIAQERTIGPWAARRATDAEILLQAALSVPYDDLPRVIVPAINTTAHTILSRYAFHLQLVVRHMRRGNPVVARPSADLYGQTSFVIG